MSHERAWILLPSGRRLDLLSPDPLAWTDRDLAIGLSRTYRWAGYSAWDLPLSVAQHSLTVRTLCEAAPGPRLTPAEALRGLLNDAVEALMGGGRQRFRRRSRWKTDRKGLGSHHAAQAPSRRRLHPACRAPAGGGGHPLCVAVLDGREPGPSQAGRPPGRRQ